MKKIFISLMILLVLTLSISFASAEFWACFSKAEKINFCNPKIPDRTCDASMGCEFCMSVYNEALNCFTPGNWMVCNTLPKNCANYGGGEIDGEPPELTISSPTPEGIFTSRSVLLDFSLDEKSDVYYIDNINGRGRWTRVCQDCQSYSRKRSFKEGLNDLTFKAKDVVGNEEFFEWSFFVDSKKPKIYGTEPKKGFIGSEFSMSFSEENPKKLTLYYGNPVKGQRNKQLNLGGDCYQSKGRTYCSAEVDLIDYDGQSIEYYFELEDIAGNIAKSKSIWLEVDETAPVLSNQNSFWLQGEGKYNKYIYFTFNINEKNFDEINYIDYSDSKPRARTLCSRLRNGICESKKSFRIGHHVVDIEIIDKAGNAIGKRIEFDVM